MDGRKKGLRLYLSHDGYPDAVKPCFKAKPSTVEAVVTKLANGFEEVMVLGKGQGVNAWLDYEYTYSLKTGELTWPEDDEDEDDEP